MSLVVILAPEKKREIECLLREQGHEVVSHAVSLVALWLIKDKRPAAVIFEWSLSDSNIIKLFRLSRRNISSPILVLLPNLEGEQRVILALKAYSLGADSCCAAASSAEQVVARLEALIRRDLACVSRYTRASQQH